MKKNMVLPVAVAVAVIGCVLAVSANVTTGKMHQNLLNERYQRLRAEENLQMAQKQIKTLKQELDDSRGALEQIQMILDKGQSANNDLRQQLETLVRERDALRGQMQNLQKEIAVPKPEDVPVLP